MSHHYSGSGEVAWVPNNLARACFGCNSAFSFSFRRHHCRNCGNIFCANCSARTFQLKSTESAVRVCDSCFTKLTEQKLRPQHSQQHWQGYLPGPQSPKRLHHSYSGNNLARSSGIGGGVGGGLSPSKGSLVKGKSRSSVGGGYSSVPPSPAASGRGPVRSKSNSLDGVVAMSVSVGSGAGAGGRRQSNQTNKKMNGPLRTLQHPMHRSFSNGSSLHALATRSVYHQQHQHAPNQSQDRGQGGQGGRLRESTTQVRPSVSSVEVEVEVIGIWRGRSILYMLR